MNDIREPWEPPWDLLKGNTDMRRKTYLNLENTHQTQWIQNREEGLRNQKAVVLESLFEKKYEGLAIKGANISEGVATNTIK